MTKPTFLTYEKPLLTCMVQGEHPARVKELIARSREAGAEAFGLAFCKLKPEHRNAATYRELFDAAAPSPVYVTNYRGYENKGKSDDLLAEELCELAACGATLCDMMGDYFDPCEGELTMNEAAIERQMALIEALHERGAEVMISSHTHRFMPAERVLEVALEQQRRGADICKIVAGADTMEEQIENLRIITLLKENLKVPFLFLSSGECHLMRRVGDTLGNCMSLSVYEYDALATKNQPLLTEMKRIRELLGE